MKALEWEQHAGCPADMWHADWKGLLLRVWTDGRWEVLGPKRAGMFGKLVDHAMQTKGKDINEAKQRAQAAAIVQLQLTGVKPQ